jgi:GNAT superfamily N-acetyltransferase
MPQGYEVRRMQAREKALAIDWAAAEGWNPGLHDDEAFVQTDPKGFLIGTLDGEPVACISAVAYDEAFGFIGFYIVRPEYRGKGYGLRLWEEAMAYLGDRNIGLDGVPAQQANYERSGFVLAHNNIRYEGMAEAPASRNHGVVKLSSMPFEQISAYDAQVFPTNRDDFLNRWLDLPDSHALGAIDGGALTGFAVIRKCRTGYKIGPLFADNETVAERLFVGLTAEVDPGSPIFIDPPEPNGTALGLAQRHGMKPVFETARMYNVRRPPIELNRVFGITTFELG